MQIIRTASEMRAWSRAQRAAGARIALVPTMGALHAGHLSLLPAARKHADLVVASVYVNPTQFAPNEDLAQYPRDLAGDMGKLEIAGCDLVFSPETLYSADREHQTWVQPGELGQGLCTLSRPHFFRGVATVVTKLFNVIEPDVAVFGKKDYQQLQIIRQLVDDLSFDVTVIGMPIVREADGLAMSSRNLLLTPAHRHAARAIPEAMTLVAEALRNGDQHADSLGALARAHIEAAGGTIDYVSIVDRESLQALDIVNRAALIAVAATFGSVRLIDNCELNPSQ